MARVWLLAVLAFGSAACSEKTVVGSCSSNAGCAAGQVCAEGECLALCQSDRDCGANDCSGSGRICADQLCVRGCRDAVPTITGVDGTGSADSSTDPRGTKASHRVRDQLVVTGSHLEGATATLTTLSGTPIELTIAQAVDSQLTATLPADLAAGEYTLTLANAVGSTQAGVWVVQGEQGPAGEPQTGAGVLALLASLGNPVPGLNAATAGSASQAFSLVDGAGTPRAFGDIVVPPGAISYFATAACPSGWLPANGAAVNRGAYAGLFAAIGTGYGEGDGSTTFQLPDLRGEFLRAWDAGRGLDSGRNVGTVQGQDQRTFTAQNSGGPTGSYTHAMAGYVPKDGSWSAENLFGGYWSAPSGVFRFAWDTTSEIRPRNVALLACIKL